MGATDTAWELRACADEPELWTLDKIHDTNPAWRAPRAICLECPVIAGCRLWVLSQAEDPAPWSMVAALTPGQRDAARADGLRSRCGTATGRKEHALLGEKPCDACKAARNAQERSRLRRAAS